MNALDGAEVNEAESNEARAKLNAFLAANHEADIKVEGKELSVVRPWGEEAIEIPLLSDDDELIDALNAVRLPPRFTAIWHEDTKEFEVIFTVLNWDSPLLDRKFEFRFRGSSYRCAFEECSARLRSIARRARPTGRVTTGRVTRTPFRNLQPFYRFERMQDENPEAEYVLNGRPTSFWIRGVDTFDDDLIRDLARNLNFHMAYFDRTSPQILIHEEPAEPHRMHDRRALGVTSFPETLTGSEIDQHLLILWDSAREGDLFLRFIHYYQILEYAGFYHVKDKVRRDIERAIVAPDAVSRPDRVAQQILDAIAADRRQDEAKINEMIEDCVDLHEMWDILSGSLSDFSQEVVLDGGFVLPALVNASADYEEFAQSWNKQFLPNLHKVRNALVHARESRQSTTIAPTTANHSRLHPWLLPLSQTAARVMLYSRL